MSDEIPSESQTVAENQTEPATETAETIVEETVAESQNQAQQSSVPIEPETPKDEAQNLPRESPVETEPAQNVDMCENVEQDQVETKTESNEIVEQKVDNIVEQSQVDAQENIPIPDSSSDSVADELKTESQVDIEEKPQEEEKVDVGGCEVRVNESNQITFFLNFLIEYLIFF